MICTNKQKLSVHYCRLVLLIIGVEQRKNLSTNCHIISIDKDHNLTWLTEIVSSYINVMTSSHIFFIVNNCIHWRRYFVLDHVFFYIFSCTIGWCIIYINDMIVCVFLLKNWVKISQINSVMGVVIWWCINTESYLVVNILGNLIFFLKVFFLLIQKFFKRLILFLWRGVKVIMIHGKLSREVNVMGQLQ